MKLVSVLMSTYQEPLEYIILAVESILDQTYSNIQLVVIIDDPLNTEAVEYLQQKARQDFRIELIINEQNLGLVASLNKGLKICNGIYIARMDADDFSESKRIETQMDFLEQNHLDLIGCSYDTFVVDYRKSEGVNIAPSSDLISQNIKIEPCLAHPTWFGKKEVFIYNQGYRDIFACEDYDFLIRAYNNGIKLGNCQDILLRYRLNPMSISHKNEVKQKVVFKFLSKNFKMGRNVTIEYYYSFISGQEYINLCTAYKYIFMMKRGKLREFIKGYFLILSKPNVLGTYIKYK